MSWVVVIPTEGRARGAAPALLLVWHRLRPYSDTKWIAHAIEKSDSEFSCNFKSSTAERTSLEPILLSHVMQKCGKRNILGSICVSFCVLVCLSVCLRNTAWDWVLCWLTMHSIDSTQSTRALERVDCRKSLHCALWVNTARHRVLYFYYSIFMVVFISLMQQKTILKNALVHVFWSVPLKVKNIFLTVGFYMILLYSYVMFYFHFLNAL